MRRHLPRRYLDARGERCAFLRRPEHRLSGPLPYHLSPELAALFEGRGSLAILEVGCGPAQSRAFFQGRGHRHVALDLANPAADVNADAMRLPFANDAFDAVLTIAMLQYVWSPYAALCEMYRVLKPGGMLTGTTAFLEPWTFGGLVHLTPGGLVDLLSRAGFETEYLWPGWNVGQAVHATAFHPLPCLGRAVSCFQTAAHHAWWFGLDALRRISGRPTRGRLLQELDFAGSINFCARKPQETGEGTADKRR